MTTTVARKAFAYANDAWLTLHLATINQVIVFELTKPWFQF